MRRSLFLSVALVALSGCGGCDDDLVAIGDDAGFGEADARAPQDSGTPFDAGFGDSGTNDSGVSARVLRFEGTSPVVITPSGTADLQFSLRLASGTPLANETIRFQQSGTAGTLLVSQAQTDAAGVGSVRFNGAANPGQSTVTASADGANPVSVVVQVSGAATGGLVLNVTSGTRIPATTAEGLLYVGLSVPTCAQLAAATTLPTATLLASFTAVPGSRTFTNQTAGARVTAYVTGKSANGVTIGAGCAEGVTIPPGGNGVVNVRLEQLPTRFLGEYDVLLHFQLGNALPHPYDETVGLVAEILSNPAGYAVFWTLHFADEQWGTSFVDWTPPGETMARPATFAEVTSNANIFNSWREASRFVDTFLVNQLGQPYIDVTNVGEDISDIVRDFEVGARWSLEAKQTSGYQITETWRSMVYSWQLGCANGDLGCARRPLAVDSVRYAPAASIYDVAITHMPIQGQTERWEVVPAEHAIVIRYGAVVLIALNELVFPNLPGNLAGNSLGEVLLNVIDCANVAQTLVNVTGLSVIPFEALCTQGVQAGSVALENLLLQMDSTDSPELVGRSEAGVSGGGRFYLIDANQDLETELVRDVTVYARWVDPNNPGLSQDIAAPITGAGRRAATGCNTDLDCTGGRVCSAIPSYLEVRDLERDCRRKVGTTPGMGACTQDAQCESNICLRSGPSGTCFEACNGAGSCAVGMCRADGATVDLDSVRTGLGDATTDACF